MSEPSDGAAAPSPFPNEPAVSSDQAFPDDRALPSDPTPVPPALDQQPTPVPPASEQQPAPMPASEHQATPGAYPPPAPSGYAAPTGGVTNGWTPPPLPTTDNVVRGTMLALLVIPIGVVLWVLLWESGFIASIVSLAVAAGATYLYRLGSGRTRIVPAAVWAIVGIIVVTLVLSILAGIAVDLVNAAGLDVATALGSSLFWAAYGHLLGEGSLWSQLSTTLLLSVLFAALGCFQTIRRLARESRASQASGTTRS